MKNQEIAKILDEMSLFLEIKEIPFKPQAYQKARYSVESAGKDIEEIYEKQGINGLMKIPGIGKGIAKRIEEYLKTGKIKDYEKLKKEFPVNIEELTSIEGVGPKHVKLFYQKLKIKNAADLERLARAGKLKELPRMGEKLEQKILKGIELRKKYAGRFLLGETLPLANEIISRLEKIKGVKKVESAGSLRRKKETVGDLDFLVISEKPETIMNYFVSMPEVVYVGGKGATKSMVKLKSGINADVRVIAPESFGAALQYFTGSKEHNILLRKIAQKMGYKLNEYGLFKGNKMIVGKTEEEVYEKLGLKWIPPELREGNEEIEFAAKNKLPKLIELKDIKGDLHVHTTWSEGANSIEEMAFSAQKLGYEYLLISDHTKYLAMTGGMDEKKLLQQIKEIDALNYKLKTKNYKLRVLKGAELNILEDGSVDIENKVLEKLDFAGAAIHHKFNLPKEKQTERLIKAMENPNIDIIYHLTGRLINQREPIQLDLEKIFATAAESKTILEINGSPIRLDLKDEHIKLAKKYGVKFAINTDAHDVNELSLMEYGVSQARRGWLEKDDVLNTLPFLGRNPKSQRLV